MDDASPRDPASTEAAVASDVLSEFEFRQLRLQNDLRLKSTFEAIFEKYGKDFTGVGDEIDLETGQIVVDNGHLSEMRDEQDVGESDGEDVGRLLRALTEQPELGREDGRPDRGTGGQTYESEDWNEVEGLPSDMGQEVVGQHHTEAQGTRKRKASALADTEGDLDQQISKYAIQLGAVDDSQVEPAWRAPVLAPTTPGARPILRSVLRSKRGVSTSPIQQGSLWAPPRPRGRPRTIPSDFFRDLKAPRATGGRRQRKIPSQIVISDDESDRGDHTSSNTGIEGQPWSGNQGSMQNTLAQVQSYRPAAVLISRDPNKPCEPRTTYQQPSQKADRGSGGHHLNRPTLVQNGGTRLHRASNDPRVATRENVTKYTDMEMALENVRHRLASERQEKRNRTLEAAENPTLRSEGRRLAEPPQERGYPSLMQLARDLFTNPDEFTVGEPPQDSQNAPDATHNNYGVDHYHTGERQLGGDESGSLWESESELQCEPESERGAALGPRRKKVPKQDHAMEMRASGSSSKRRSKGSRLNPPEIPAALLPKLPQGGEFVVSLKDDGFRPRYTHHLLCGTAILSAPEKKLTIRQIQQWIRDHFSYFRRIKGWEDASKASMRPTYGFVAAGRHKPDPRCGFRGGYYWTILPKYVYLYLKGSGTREDHRLRFLRSFEEVEQADSLQTPEPDKLSGPPRTPAGQASCELVPHSTPISSLLKRSSRAIVQEPNLETTVKGPQPSQGVVQKQNLNIVTQRPQPKQVMPRRNEDILKFSDTD
ncbi:MAG: hypothetical protein M1839_004329 [Geoglossum umbratile]|nr:MAG: hypothetical protein M1839_004329 [Geoglossum umbratile]